MSDVGSGLVKLAYRGFAGFFVVLMMFVFGVVGASLALAGGLTTALCWVPMAYPELLDNVNLVVIGSTSLTSADAGIATMALFIAGLILLAVGFLFLAITFIIGKAAIVVDKEVAHLVDRAFILSNRDRLSQLERLANLRDQGVLTEEEFQREKGLLLGTQANYAEGEPSMGFQFVDKE
ncbi:MAG: SHOCT domain-containing protein [Candidatus Heimdallarchaeota archaeon]|nr:SHOCT domain-containing protein [Candidatus Heimdallarchaeota archaeon]